MTVTQPTVRATRILRDEHEVILDVLEGLEKLAQDALEQRALDFHDAADALEFLATFADRCHHAKEERALFPMLERKGLPRSFGPLAVMLSEHDEGRAKLAAMRAALAARAPERFGAHARAYVELLRDHISKEDQILFPMADGLLGENEQREVLEAFGSIEEGDLGAGTHERELARVERLLLRLGVQRAKRAAAPANVCCGHHKSCH
jgi:hemerythrin-like domain-containing protein